MEYGFCNLSHVAVRATYTSQSEMTNQLLFGDSFEILERHKEWLYIRNAFDAYEGWINSLQCLEITEDTFKYLNNESNPYFVKDIICFISDLNNNHQFPIVRGSCIPKIDENNIFIIDNQKFKLNTNKTTMNPLSITSFASMYLNAPYLWGGRSPFGIDCSGFTQVVFRVFGIKLMRDANQQAEQGLNINSIEEAKENDLAFFENKEGQIIHVGIILKDNFIIHASGKVRIDKIDNKGIINSNSEEYSHNLKTIKRIVV